MADAQAPEESPWKPLWILLAVFFGCLAILWQEGRLSELRDARSWFVSAPIPTTIQTQP